MFTSGDFPGAQTASYFLLFVVSPAWKILTLGLSCVKENLSDPPQGPAESAWMI